MKTLPRLTAVLSAAFMLFGLVGCSQEGAEAKKVNISVQIDALKSDNADTRVNACIELAKAGPNAAPAVAALTAALKDSNRDVRRLAAYALGEIGPAAKSALPTLKTLMTGTDREMDNQIVNSMAAIDPSSSQQRVPNVQTP